MQLDKKEYVILCNGLMTEIIEKCDELTEAMQKEKAVLCPGERDMMPLKQKISTLLFDVSRVISIQKHVWPPDGEQLEMDDELFFEEEDDELKHCPHGQAL